MKRLMILASSLALFSACSEEKMPENLGANEELKSITIPIYISDTQTRVAVNEDESTDDNWKFEWENDQESVAVWHNSGCTSFAEFEMDQFDKDLSTFKGSVPMDATQIRVVSPYDASAMVSGNTCSIDISEQDGNLGKLYMISDKLIDVEDTDVTGAKPNMKHLGGFFALNFKLENAQVDTAYEITKVEMSGVPTTMSVDMTGNYDSNSNTNSDGTITASLSGKVFGADDIMEVRLNILPFDFEPNDEINFNITYKYNGVERSTSLLLKNPTSSSVPFERAKFNYCTIKLDGSKGITVSGATINGWTQGNGSEGEDLGELKPKSPDIALVDGIYQIHSAKGLQAFASIVNNSSTDVSGLLTEGIDNTLVAQNTSANGKLMNDIDLSTVCGAELNGGTNWATIGNSYNRYTGTFDGNNFKVSRLYINSTVQYQGLFGYAENATIQNLGVSGSVTGYCFIGGILGYAKEATTIINCYNEAKITAISTSSWAGGIAGYIRVNSYIVNCYNVGEINGKGSLGGIIGMMYYYSYVVNCYNKGKVLGTSSYVGGITGRMYNAGNVVTACYNVGEVSSTTTSSVGSIVGAIQGEVTNTYYLQGSCAGDANNVGNSTEMTADAMKQYSFVNELYIAADAYNTANPTKPQACGWEQATDDYPTFTENKD